MSSNKNQVGWNVLEEAAKRGKLLITKECNAPVNIGKSPVAVLWEQLQRAGYVIRKESDG